MEEMEVGNDGICVWAGRRAVPLALGAIEIMCGVVMAADSALLRIILAKSSDAVRVMALKFLQHVKDRWREQIRAKFQYWKHTPYNLNGLMGMYFGYSVAECCNC